MSTVALPGRYITYDYNEIQQNPKFDVKTIFVGAFRAVLQGRSFLYVLRWQQQHGDRLEVSLPPGFALFHESYTCNVSRPVVDIIHVVMVLFEWKLFDNNCLHFPQVMMMCGTMRLLHTCIVTHSDTMIHSDNEWEQNCYMQMQTTARSTIASVKANWSLQ